VFGDNLMFGTKLDGTAALTSPLLPDFWDMVDHLQLNALPWPRSPTPTATVSDLVQVLQRAD